ncbi:MAG: tripartite tricarboxylate transporter substrate binding protein [Burkholderiaceae bacterium]|nr:tripartite tricarboxylate transporter substrate binding protein [Burkholderiaceae bacterium]
MSVLHRLGLSLCVAALTSSAALAQQPAWPTKPLRVLVPFAPGGNTDSIARVTAEFLGRKLGQTVVVENRPGANGAIAADAVARATPDGYTLFMATAPQMAILPQLTKTNYDPVKDFEPVTIVASNVFAMAVGSGTSANTLGEFVAAARAQPGKISYASAGNGSVSHLSMAMFVHAAKLDMVHVTYKGGAPAIADVMAGHVPVYFANLPEVLPQVAGGKIRVLAVSSPRRVAQLPNVPTVAESGWPDFKTETWNGLAAPAKTPKAVVDRIATEMAAIAKDPEFIKRMDTLGVQVICNTPAEMARQLRDDISLWGEAIRVSGAKLE